jgi:hypothetical protein
MKTQYEKDAQLGRTIRVVLVYGGTFIGGALLIPPAIQLYFKLVGMAFDSCGYVGAIVAIIAPFVLFGIGGVIVDEVKRKLYLAEVGEHALAAERERAKDQH